VLAPSSLRLAFSAKPGPSQASLAEDITSTTGGRLNIVGLRQERVASAKTDDEAIQTCRLSDPALSLSGKLGEFRTPVRNPKNYSPPTAGRNPALRRRLQLRLAN